MDDKSLHHQLHSKDAVEEISNLSHKFVNTCKNCSYIFRILTTEVVEFCSKGNKQYCVLV